MYFRHLLFTFSSILRAAYMITLSKNYLKNYFCSYSVTIGNCGPFCHGKHYLFMYREYIHTLNLSKIC